MQNTYRAAAITSVTGIAITIYARNTTNQHDRVLGLGVLMIGLVVLFGIVGLVLGIIEKTRPLAKGVFLGMGIFLLVGFAICTL